MKISDRWKQAADEQLAELARAISAETGIVLATEDGLELLSHGRDETRVSRLSAMASSMTALGVMAGEECSMGEFKSITLELSDGFMLMLQVTVDEVNLILGIIAERKATIGQVLHSGKRAAARLQQFDHPIVNADPH